MIIREAKLSDVTAMLEIYRPYVEQTAVSFEYVLPSETEFAHRLREHKRDYPWLVCEEDGEILGYAYAGRAFERAAYAWNAEISCYLKRRGEGIGKRLYGIIEKILTAQGCRRVYAVVTSANAPSVAFHKAIGYREALTYRNVGFKLGQWHDVIWLEKELCDLGAPEQFPVSWHELNWREFL